MAQKFVKEDFTGEYSSNSDCAIARAVKRIFNPLDVKVYPDVFYIRQSVDDKYVPHYFKSIRLNGKTIENRKFGSCSFGTIKEHITFNTFNMSELDATFSITKECSTEFLSEWEASEFFEDVARRLQDLNTNFI